MVLNRAAKGAASGCGASLLFLTGIGILGYVMAVCGAPIWFVVAACGTITFFVFIIVRARLTNVGFRTIAVGDYRSAQLYNHDCPYCTAGAQTLITINGKTHWGPIPEQNRIWFDGTDHFHSKLANVRSCNYCHGLGYRRLPYPPKTPYDLTREEEDATLNSYDIDPPYELDIPEDM